MDKDQVLLIIEDYIFDIKFPNNVLSKKFELSCYELWAANELKRLILFNNEDSLLIVKKFRKKMHEFLNISLKPNNDRNRDIFESGYKVVNEIESVIYAARF